MRHPPLSLILCLCLPTAALAAPAPAPPFAVKAAASFTVSAWVRLNTLAGSQTFVSRSGANAVAFALQKRATDDRFAFTVSQADAPGSATVAASSDFAPTPGVWYQLVGVYNAAAHQIRLYANGTPLASASATLWRSGGPMDLAAGSVERVRLFPRALSDAQVAAKYRTGLSRFQPHTFTWANPIYFQGDGPQDAIHDPDILRDDGVYYLVSTLWPFTNYTDYDPAKPDGNSSPGIALYASRDLKVWKFQRWLVKSSDLPDTAPYKHQFWAPELHKIDGRYYVIFGGSNWIDAKYDIGGRMGYSQFVAVADKVGGPYTHFTALPGPGVDTSLFQDSDGKTYVVWPGNEIHPVDLTGIPQDTVTVGPKISQAATPQDYAAIGRPAPDTVEGPYLIKHAGTYYCFFAETYRGPGGSYDTGVATARSLAGPWALDPRWRVFPGGHQALFVGPDGRWWTSYKHEESGTSDWLSVDPITFDSAGRVQVTPSQGPQSVRLPLSDPR